jgi:hypothetical protein
MSAAIKRVSLRNEESGNEEGFYFEPTDAFRSNVARSMTPLVRTDGKQVQVNKKLLAKGHYEERGFVTPEQHRMANARAVQAAKREEGGK